MITYADLAAELKTRWPAVDQKRIDRALNILSTESIMRARKSADGCDIEPSNALFAVRQSHRSANPDDQWYLVNPYAKTCTCPDSELGHICKHRIAVWLYLEYPKRYQAQAEALALAKRTLSKVEISTGVQS